MRRRLTILTILFLSTLISRGQDYDTKSFGIGFNTSVPLLSARVPGSIPITPNLYFSVQRHEIMFGIAVYRSYWAYDNNYWMKEYFQNKIYGFQLNYKYYLFKSNRKFNLFAECDLKYVQYGIGTYDEVPYNYLPIDYSPGFHNLIRNKSFLNTFGIGIKYTFLKCVGLQFALSGGYNYYQSNYSPTNYSHIGIQYVNYYYDAGNKILPIVCVELGLSFKLWKEKPSK